MAPLPVRLARGLGQLALARRLAAAACSLRAGPGVSPLDAAYSATPSAWGVVIVRGQRTEAPVSVPVSVSTIGDDVEDDVDDVDEMRETGLALARAQTDSHQPTAPPVPMRRTRSPRRTRPAPGDSLLERYPKLAAEWDEERNAKATTEVSWGSQYLAAWRCSKDPSHRWRASVIQRTRPDGGTGCPQCSRSRRSPTTGRPGRDASLEARSLLRVAPVVAAEWHPTLNGELTPREVTYGTPRKFWWQCASDHTHEWEASVYKRVVMNRRCPYCSVSSWGVTSSNSLLAVAPRVAAEWVPELNGGLMPDGVRAGSNIRAWWRCSCCKHVWPARIGGRAVNGTGCPACRNRVVTAWNNLQALYPRLAEQWDVEANGGLLPSQVVPFSVAKRWWRCSDCGWKWEAAPVFRTRADRPTGCPACARNRFHASRAAKRRPSSA